MSVSCPWAVIAIERSPERSARIGPESPNADATLSLSRVLGLVQITGPVCLGPSVHGMVPARAALEWVGEAPIARVLCAIAFHTSFRASADLRLRRPAPKARRRKVERAGTREPEGGCGAA